MAYATTFLTEIPDLKVEQVWLAWICFHVTTLKLGVTDQGKTSPCVSNGR
jgi:hypothetical protein